MRRKPLLLLFALALTGCADRDRSPELCWSTSTLRVQLGTQVFDIPAQVHPVPYPNKGGGVVLPRYPVHYREGAPRLIYCQDRDHVPLRVDSVFFDGSFIKASKLSLPWGDRTFPKVALSDVQRSEVFRRTWPLANGLAVERWSLLERRVEGDWTVLKFEDGKGRSAHIRCLNPMLQKPSRMGPQCMTDVAVGDVAAYIRFRSDKTDPRDYPKLINTAARAVLALSQPNRSHKRRP